MNQVDWYALGSDDRESQKLADAGRRHAWRVSDDRRRVRKLSFVFCTASLMAGLGIGFFFGTPLARFFLSSTPDLASRTLTLALIALGLAVATSGMWIRLAYREWLDKSMIESARRRLESAQANVGSVDQQADLKPLWEVTQRRLDYYHRIATSQAEKSFHNARRAILFGLVFIVVCAILAAAASSTPAAVVVGVLGVSGGGLAGYIASTFLRMQESTSGQLTEYFRQPLQYSKILAAERLLKTIDDAGQRSAATSAVAQAIVTE